jgi:hypothetical protein
MMAEDVGWWLTLSVTSTGTGSPDGWLGILGVLASLALLADLALERFSSAAQLPTVGGNRATTRVALAVVATLSRPGPRQGARNATGRRRGRERARTPVFTNA